MTGVVLVSQHFKKERKVFQNKKKSNKSKSLVNNIDRKIPVPAVFIS